ncbi:MAG TPA: TrbI/VirB10 family protein [Caulobacteraceae bacterium]|jgi:type IV secretion system protein VirB10|nr:TrbI/VirB10 family protein [Caulobacteraceae bacterium]
MINAGFYSGRDPRLGATSDELAHASVRSAPEVGHKSSAAEGLGLAVGLIGAATVGGLTILSLAHQHSAALEKPATHAPRSAAVATAPPARSTASPPVAAAIPAAPATPADASPVLVLDNGSPPASTVAAPVRSAPAQSAGAAKPETYFSQDEQFAARAGGETPPVSQIHKIEHPDLMIAQGAVIPAVLETALNSDLPGYARALVSRDVRSFDGSKVLIPRGSRLVGQYKSALQTGQTRMLVIWTRVLRPDGVSIQLGSPTTTDDGETGLTGKVDTHFLQRFGGAILLSVISGLASAVGSSSTVVIGTASQGGGAAAVALQNDIKTSPTVRVMQGAPIQVFVARDLDFSDGGQ